MPWFTFAETGLVASRLAPTSLRSGTGRDGAPQRSGRGRRRGERKVGKPKPSRSVRLSEWRADGLLALPMAN